MIDVAKLVGLRVSGRVGTPNGATQLARYYHCCECSALNWVPFSAVNRWAREWLDACRYCHAEQLVDNPEAP